MDTVLILSALSAALGFATGLRFNVFAMAAVSVLLALGSAIVLRAHGFGAAGGILVVVVCLLASQIAYLAGVMSVRGAGILADDISGGRPDDNRQGDVGDDEKKQDPHPPRPPSAPHG
ncbi:MAG: hypothetical protein EKK40_15780 [Bradyrhizobiaceae bacterium]|nr:MAG: hypothetical protein EKK40_15780 [Bradyrhizobiaceae bacterium]